MKITAPTGDGVNDVPNLKASLDGLDWHSLRHKQLGESRNVVVLLHDVVVSCHNVEKDTSSICSIIQIIDCNTATS